MIENIDRWLGSYLEELRQSGELENTLVVYSSDHGEMLGDHDRWGKTLPYHASTCVPLVMSGPGVNARGVSDALVNHIDLASTFLECAYAVTPKDMDEMFALAGAFGQSATSSGVRPLSLGAMAPGV